jgi:hypothetical protein
VTDGRLMASPWTKSAIAAMAKVKPRRQAAAWPIRTLLPGIAWRFDPSGMLTPHHRLGVHKRSAQAVQLDALSHNTEYAPEPEADGRIRPKGWGRSIAWHTSGRTEPTFG